MLLMCVGEFFLLPVSSLVVFFFQLGNTDKERPLVLTLHQDNRAFYSRPRIFFLPPIKMPGVPMKLTTPEKIAERLSAKNRFALKFRAHRHANEDDPSRSSAAPSLPDGFFITYAPWFKCRRWRWLCWPCSAGDGENRKIHNRFASRNLVIHPCFFLVHLNSRFIEKKEHLPRWSSASHWKSVELGL